MNSVNATWMTESMIHQKHMQNASISLTILYFMKTLIWPPRAYDLHLGGILKDNPSFGSQWNDESTNTPTQQCLDSIY
jgi:hypothetical protein